MNPEAIFNEAMEAARQAVRNNRHLERPEALDCGFAWVVIRPARGPFISWLRSQKKAHVEAAPKDRRSIQMALGEADRLFGSVRDYGGGGWQFWMPGGQEHSGQSVAIFEAGAKAMAEVLTRHGLSAQASSRLD